MASKVLGKDIGDCGDARLLLRGLLGTDKDAWDNASCYERKTSDMCASSVCCCTAHCFSS